MSHGQPSCTTVPLGKSMRRALRAAIGKQKHSDKPKKKKKPRDPAAESGGGVSTELICSSLVARREAVVRVVLKSGVVEVYPGVVLACTVIRKHPPGLCLAHPDVFRNPHGAVVRPLEPLFPGQKFLLVPESTVIRLKQKIPESSVGAFTAEEADLEEEEVEDGEASEEVTSEGDQDYSSGAAASSEEDEGSSMPACSAREYYVAKERWSECHFKKLVAQGLAVEQITDQPERQEKAKKKGKTKKRKGKKRRDRPAAPPAGLRLRTFATLRRTWEPSLPSVEEEEVASPLHPPSEEAGTDDHEQ